MFFMDDERRIEQRIYSGKINIVTPQKLCYYKRSIISV